jgi:hypothetical protein
MLQWVCPPGGSYWDPKPFWWLRNSWVATIAIRILQALRLVAWFAWTAISFAGTLISDVLFPFVQWVWALVMGFLQFYIALIFGYIALEILLFLPFLLLGLAWLWWVFWPQIGCWLDTAWPIFRLMLDLLVAVAGTIIQMFNIVVRMWNSFVPVIGFVVYFSTDLLVQFYRGVASLIGEANVEIMFDGLTEISLFMSQIAVNVAIALINISPTLLQVFSVVVGGICTTILEIAPVLLQITFVVFRVLPFKIGPIADLVVKVVSFVKKTFFLRQLLELAGAGLSAASSVAGAGRLASTASEPRNDAHSDQQLMLWRVFGDSASRYWTVDSAQQSSDHLTRINAWLLKNPPGSHTDYHTLQGGDLIHSANSYYAGSAPLRAKRASTTTESSTSETPSASERPPRLSTELPEAWSAAWNHSAAGGGDESHYPYGGDPRNGDQLYYLSAEQRHKLEAHHERLSDKPLEAELHKRLPCHSHFCGGEGQTVEHPMRVISRTHVHDRTLLANLVPGDIRAHRKRSAHLTTLLHSAHHTAHRGFSFWRDNRQHVYNNIGDAWQRWTGHATFGAAMEQWTSRYEDPMDSLIAYTPVLSEIWPFRALLDAHPPEEQAKYYGRWASKRRFFVAEITDEYTGAKRRVMHVTLNEYNATAAAAATSTEESEAQQQHRAKRQQGFGAGGVSVKTSGAGNENNEQGVATDQFGGVEIPGYLFLGQILAPVPAAAIGAFVAGRVLEPALPLLKILYKLNCFDEPKNPFCIPEMPSQVNCLLRGLVRQIPRDLRVRLCGFEEECADIGFCIHKRPPTEPVVSIVKSRAYFVSFCWLQNFFVWIGIAIGAIFPFFRFSFFIAESAVPVLGPLIFGPIRRLFPEPVSRQDSVCLLIYLYAPVLVLFLLWLFRFAWALIQWGIGAVMGLLDVLSSIRGIELARLEALSQEPWVDEMRLKVDRDARHTLYHDTVFKPMYPVHPTNQQNYYSPYAAGDYHRLMANRPPGSGFPLLPYTDYNTEGLPPALATEAAVRSGMYSQVPLPVPVERRIGADIEQPRSLEGAESALLQGRAAITPRGYTSLTVFIDALERGAKLFGQASSEPTTVHDVWAHEARWHHIIQTAHYSATWIAATIREAAHQRQQYAQRRPPLMSYMRGLFRWY